MSHLPKAPATFDGSACDIPQERGNRGNNHYQQDAQIDDVHQAALDEFDGMVDDLRGRGVNVMVVEDDPTTDTPDALFPNNWVSFHADSRVGLYPMFAPNRRLERRKTSSTTWST